MVGVVVEQNGVKSLISLAGATAAGIPVGSVLEVGSTSVPAGFLPCNGSTYDISRYPSLYTVLATNRLPTITSPRTGFQYIIKAVAGKVEVDDAEIYSQIVELLKTAYVPRELTSLAQTYQLAYYNSTEKKWYGISLPSASNQVLTGVFSNGVLTGYSWRDINDVVADSYVKSI